MGVSNRFAVLETLSPISTASPGGGRGVNFLSDCSFSTDGPPITSSPMLAVTGKMPIVEVCGWALFWFILFLGEGAGAVEEVDDWEERVGMCVFFALWWVSRGEIGEGRGRGVEGSEVAEILIVENPGAAGREICAGGWVASGCVV
ncbi:hypothetical protein M7I_6131 [Glarea lozoyensis 74030]|uniref:Uncharacterized protein n=1 Tax=Glarea lozoyensis (strain ATCC 74030 / MF5533) TaxID=1104152 RepID=H0ETR3_GLAL7|nr:hypothetical protein M7I_6131 [Glarea lozoyensis 74030]